MLGDLKYRSQALLLTALVEGDIGIIIKPTHNIRIIIIIYICILYTRSGTRFDH